MKHNLELTLAWRPPLLAGPSRYLPWYLQVSRRPRPALARLRWYHFALLLVLTAVLLAANLLITMLVMSGASNP